LETTAAPSAVPTRGRCSHPRRSPASDALTMPSAVVEATTDTAPVPTSASRPAAPGNRGSSRAGPAGDGRHQYQQRPDCNGRRTNSRSSISGCVTWRTRTTSARYRPTAPAASCIDQRAGGGRLPQRPMTTVGEGVHTPQLVVAHCSNPDLPAICQQPSLTSPQTAPRRFDAVSLLTSVNSRERMDTC
jgi:hypothetical protein